MAQKQVDLNAPNLVFAPYIYRIDATTVALGSTTVPLQLDPDADFELHYIMGSSSEDDPAAFVNNNFSVAISDKGNSRNWSNLPIFQKVLCGPDNGAIPLRRPVLIAAKTNLSFAVTDLANAANTVSILLVGFKVITP